MMASLNGTGSVPRKLRPNRSYGTRCHFGATRGGRVRRLTIARSDGFSERSSSGQRLKGRVPRNLRPGRPYRQLGALAALVSKVRPAGLYFRRVRRVNIGFSRCGFADRSGIGLHRAGPIGRRHETHVQRISVCMCGKDVWNGKGSPVFRG
jgi:hypothetical protein